MIVLERTFYVLVDDSLRVRQVHADRLHERRFAELDLYRPTGELLDFPNT
jgi:hypothetical protein